MTPLARSHVADEDLALTQRIVGGEHAAFELVMRRYNRRLFRLARATLRDDAEAEDALQEAYIAAYRNLGQFRGEAALATWLSRLVLNECLARLRRTARRNVIAPIFSPASEERLEGFPHSASGKGPGDGLGEVVQATFTNFQLDHNLLVTATRAFLARTAA